MTSCGSCKKELGRLEGFSQWRVGWGTCTLCEKCVGIFHQQKQLQPTAVSPSDNKENSSPLLFQGKTLPTKCFLQLLIIQDWSPIEPSQSPELLRWSLEHPGFTLSCTSSARGPTQLPMFISRLSPSIFHLYCCGESSSEKHVRGVLVATYWRKRAAHLF